MRAINLMDQERRDAPVAMEPVNHVSGSGFALEDGHQVQSVKVIKNTFKSHLPAIQKLSEAEGKEIEDLLIEGDPEIDFDYMGKISNKTKTIYIDENEKISYSLRFKERKFSPDGEMVEEADYQRTPANVNSDIPLKWTGKFIPIKKVVKMVAFTKIYQLRHVNGLTYDFLYEMARNLEEKKSFMLLGAGPSGKEPLCLTRGALPYRAFLRGRTKGDSYCLSLHLANLELKDLS